MRKVAALLLIFCLSLTQYYSPPKALAAQSCVSSTGVFDPIADIEPASADLKEGISTVRISFHNLPQGKRYALRYGVPYYTEALPGTNAVGGFYEEWVPKDGVEVDSRGNAVISVDAGHSKLTPGRHTGTLVTVVYNAATNRNTYAEYCGDVTYNVIAQPKTNYTYNTCTMSVSGPDGAAIARVGEPLRLEVTKGPEGRFTAIGLGISKPFTIEKNGTGHIDLPIFNSPQKGQISLFEPSISPDTGSPGRTFCGGEYEIISSAEAPKELPAYEAPPGPPPAAPICSIVPKAGKTGYNIRAENVSSRTFYNSRYLRADGNSKLIAQKQTGDLETTVEIDLYDDTLYEDTDENKLKEGTYLASVYDASEKLVCSTNLVIGEDGKKTTEVGKDGICTTELKEACSSKDQLCQYGQCVAKSTSGGEKCDPATGDKIEPKDPKFSSAGGIITAIGCVPTNPVELMKTIIKFSIGIGGGIALLMMIIASFEMITSAGNADRLKNGQDRFKNAVIGLLFIIFSVLLLRLIGVDILGLGAYLGV